jgi:hypothetical protein
MTCVIFTVAMVFEDASLLRCDLEDTSYSIDFEYVNGVQNVNVASDTTGHSPLVNGSLYFASSSFDSENQAGDQVGCGIFHASDGFDVYDPTCTFHLDDMRRLAYESIV